MPGVAFEVHNIDCLELAVAPASVDTIYLDPPYGPEKEDTYYGVGDGEDGYLDYMRVRLERLSEFLKSDGNLLIHIDYKYAHYLKVCADRIFGRKNFRNEIIWAYSSPSVAKRFMPRKHDTILWYGRGDYVYNPERVPYADGLAVGGETSWAGEKKDTSDYIDRGKLLPDWWTDIPSLCRNEKERRSYKTQKPIKLLLRIVKMFSNEGQTIMDPFCGSGTTIEAAVQLGRYGVGADISAEACEITRLRCSDRTR